MGESTDGQLCCGIMFEDYFEFPWDDENVELDEWWREVNNCQVESPFTEWGYKPGVTDSGDYWDQLRQWDKENPIPVELVNYCSGDCPAWILAVPSSVRSCSRGDPLKFDPTDLIVTLGEVRKLLKFCEQFKIKATEPAWYLSSYWG